VFGLASVQGRALGFHVLTEDGAQSASAHSRTVLEGVGSRDGAGRPATVGLHAATRWPCIPTATLTGRRDAPS
jgi:hypothetical protein